MISEESLNHGLESVLHLTDNTTLSIKQLNYIHVYLFIGNHSVSNMWYLSTIAKALFVLYNGNDK